MCPKGDNRSIALLAGPTAVGKTAVSIEVANLVDAEIISADARQLYRHLDVGTAKPSSEDLSRAPHHFVSELEPHQSYSAGKFARAAEDRIRTIRDRARMPLVVGGSTLYIEALVTGLSDIPDVDPAVRSELNTRLREEGAAALYRELETLDPASAAAMDATKSQRIVRALEVYYGTGTPLSEFHASRSSPAFKYTGVVLTRPRDDLYRRINTRVDDMLSEGLVDEVRGLLDRGMDQSLVVLRTIGYREVVDFLAGRATHDEMVRLIKRNSRRYAKRQITWFRRFADFVEIDADAPVDNVVEALGLRCAPTETTI